MRIERDGVILSAANPVKLRANKEASPFLSGEAANIKRGAAAQSALSFLLYAFSFNQIRRINAKYFKTRKRVKLHF